MRGGWAGAHLFGHAIVSIDGTPMLARGDTDYLTHIELMLDDGHRLPVLDPGSGEPAVASSDEIHDLLIERYVVDAHVLADPCHGEVLALDLSDDNPREQSLAEILLQDEDCLILPLSVVSRVRCPSGEPACAETCEEP